MTDRRWIVGLGALVVLVAVVIGASVGIAASRGSARTPAGTAAASGQASAGASAGPSAGTGSADPAKAIVRGTVVALQPGGLTLRDAAGAVWTVRLAPKVRYGTAAHPTTAAQVVPGATVAVQGPQDGHGVIAHHIWLVGAGTGGSGGTPGSGGPAPSASA